MSRKAVKEVSSSSSSLVKTDLSENSKLEKEWTLHIDSTSGNQYYFNAYTGESKWVDSESDDDDSDTDNDSDDRFAGDEWTLHTDTASGNDYYYNSETGESVWADSEGELDGEDGEDSDSDERVVIVKKRVKCHFCHEVGHMRKKCPHIGLEYDPLPSTTEFVYVRNPVPAYTVFCVKKRFLILNIFFSI